MIAFSIVTTMLIACSSGEKVEVVKAASTSSTIQPAHSIQAQLPQHLPNNVTAICRDGSYSTATDDSACLGNGGVSTKISRYHSE
ncbi:hypothetical protein C5N92_03435 [Glaesserella australis]|uniref:DUF3761 domain-containing protein n=2 Tax=Pasteurellaceae TaxID=712 RepID=A0A328C083_9PAST|nr:hypothetical protein CJD39_06010 [Glaesserella sp. 15-184]RAL19335.1 hypothetical protein C5N92_03435 [Glaesserella australis]